MSCYCIFIFVLKFFLVCFDLIFMILFLFLYLSEKKDSVILFVSVFLVLLGMLLECEFLDMNLNFNEKR